MRQILHIFRKDVRHHWPEILVSLAVLIAFAVDQPRKWTDQPAPERILGTLLNILPILMVLAWAFLIVRLVQSESLVGDRQFWITRPYRWYKLLAAKLLSILVFVNLPLFVTQLILLKIAHFPVLHSIPGLLFIHMLLAFSIVMPALAIACITSGIGQAALTLLAISLLVIGLAFLSSVLPGMDMNDSTDTFQAAIFLIACLTTILLQYLYRKTFVSRSVVTAGIVCISLIVVLAPYEKLITREFPLPAPAHPLPAQLSFDRTLSFDHENAQRSFFYGDQVELELPFQVSGLDDKTIAQISAVKLDLVLPSGEQWSSQWLSINQFLSVGRTRLWPTVKMKRALFNRIETDHMRAHVTLGFNVFQIESRTQIAMAGKFLRLPGDARCFNEISRDSLHCFSALRQPSPLLVVADLPSTDCSVSDDASIEPWAPAPASFADLSVTTTPDFDFTPIQQLNISLSRFYEFEDHESQLPVCPGTPLLVARPKFRYSVRDEIDLGDITLSNYLPTYPRKIVPPMQHPTPEPRSGTS